jgi:ribosomal protein S18 acetylase RimI-like enzyme
MATLTVRPMRSGEYVAYAALRDAEYADSLSGALPRAAAEEKARKDRSRFLPDGTDTEGHLLLVAEDDAGDVVGQAWLGLSHPQTGAHEVAWLFDIHIKPEYRGRGHGRAMLDAVEETARQAGAKRLALNVFGANKVAIDLYAKAGYGVTSQQMAKPLQGE